MPRSQLLCLLVVSLFCNVICAFKVLLNNSFPVSGSLK